MAEPYDITHHITLEDIRFMLYCEERTCCHYEETRTTICTVYQWVGFCMIAKQGSENTRYLGNYYRSIIGF